jgi:2-amino-4-hydroxy-6-hydroxymethyldihydropteridine diphosphokinase
MARLTRIYLALGSNLGDRLEFFQRTLDSIKSIAKLERVAPIYETEPWGITDQPRFLNTVAEAKTHLEPIELLMMIKTIEKTLGRKSTLRNGPRVIDMDILLYGSQQVSLPELEIPHPRLLERVFALAPLADLAPDLRPPGWKLSVRGQLESLDRSGVSLFPAALLNLKVLPAGATGGSAMVNLPAEVGLALGKTGSAPVRCRINNIEFRTTISPTGIGTHTMVLNQQLRREAGFKAGDDPAAPGIGQRTAGGGNPRGCAGSVAGIPGRRGPLCQVEFLPQERIHGLHRVCQSARNARQADCPTAGQVEQE